MKPVLVMIAVLFVAGCGGRQELTPRAGASLPPKPAFARAQPTPEQLMTADTQARPQRSEELLKRSELRRNDPFDLPPPG